MTSLQKCVSTSDCNSMKLAMRYQMDGTIDPRPKRGPDVKIIIQSFRMTPADDQKMNVSRANACNPAKMFKSLIQRANDSGSMDTSLEYKPLSKNDIKRAHSVHQKIPYVDELREVLKKNENLQSSGNGQKMDGIRTPSKLPFTNRKNLPQIPIESKLEPKNNPKTTSKICDPYIVDSVKLKKKMPMSSTPYRAKADNETNNNCKEEINLMTPAADVQFIDMDVDVDIDDENNKPLIKCFSLTRASCRRMASFRKNLRKQGSNSEIFVETSPKFERRTLFTSSLNSKTNRSSVVLPDETSPLRRQKNVKVKNSKLLNFFRPSKVNEEETQCSKHESNLTQTCNNLTQLLAKSDHIFDELGCAPLLTKDNVDFYTGRDDGDDDDLNDSDQTIGWGNKFEFSYICEPSTSDIEEEEYDLNDAAYLPTVKNGTKFSRIPFVKISPPSTETIASARLKTDRVYSAVNSTPFRRSVSDPALIRLASIYNQNNQNTNSDFVAINPFDYFNNASGNIVSGSFYRNV